MSLILWMTVNILSFITLVLAVSTLVFITIAYILTLLFRTRRVSKKDGITIGIFHPYCNAGGGGEKVLWCAIRALQKQHPSADITVYTGDRKATPEQILQLASRQLNTPLTGLLRFQYLSTRSLVEAYRYPVCTLLGQSLGSILVGAEAMWRFLPDVYIDTMGYAFTMPLFSWVGGCRVGCYVHYPTITPDMLYRVSQRVAAHNNRAIVAHSPLLTNVKLLYYRMFAWMYRLAGRAADVVMVNSSWTKGHVEDLWGRRGLIHLVYPPCEVTHLESLQHTKTNELRVVSVGQFRPEKDHPLQMRAFQLVRDKVPHEVWSKVKLVVIGSCRDHEDEERVSSVKVLAEELNISNNVEFKVNVSFKELLEQYELGTVGLHTMWNEHFGIGVVECMAAGLVMVAHRSGGPKMDIVDDSSDTRTGYLAESAEQYADAIVHIINTPPDELEQIRKAARVSVKKFSVEVFENKFLEAINSILDTKKRK